MLCQRGTQTPRRSLVVVWGCTIGLTAAVLLLAGGLSAIQTACIVIGVPFVVLLIGACFSFIGELRREPRPPYTSAEPTPDVPAAPSTRVSV